jgi:predicted P-loop ATPase/GTPase
LTFKILVVGLRPVDAGKTTLAASLARALKREGYDVVALKPVGSVEAWIHPEALRWTAERGFVITPDAMRLSEATGGSTPLEAVEPVAAIHAPPDPARWDWNPSPYQVHLSDPNRTTALLRLTACRPGGGSTLHLVNVEALDRAPLALKRKLVDASSRLQPPPLRVDYKGVERLLAADAIQAADSCSILASQGREVVVVESFSDAAAPTPWSLDAHMVVAVAPGVAGLVDGGRYSRAVELRGGDENPALVSAGEAVHLAGVSAKVELPLLDDPESGYSSGDLAPILESVRAFTRA